jgi:hypothetical protein
MYICTLSNIPTFFVDGLGHPKVTGTAALLSGFFYLMFALPLTVKYGINGLAFAFLISQLIIVPYFIWYVNSKILKISTLTLIRVAYLKTAAMSIIVYLALKIIPIGSIQNLGLLILYICLSGLFCFSIFLLG